MASFKGVVTGIVLILQSIFVMICLAIFYFGIFILSGNGEMKKWGKELLDKIKAGISNAGLDGANSFSTDNFDLANYLRNIGITLTVTAPFLMLVPLFGILGVTTEGGRKRILIINAAIMIVFFLAEIVLRFIATDIAKGPLKDAMKNYQGLNGTNVESITWNLIMQTFQCCGIQDYKDFSSTAWWGNKAPTLIKMPLACCLTLPRGLDCANTLNSIQNNFDKGCVDSMWNSLMKYDGITWITFFAQVVLIVCDVLLHMVPNRKVNPEDRRGSSYRHGQQIDMGKW